MVKGRKTMRRLYLFEGRKIPSLDVGVLLHRARSGKRDVCGICLKPIEAGEEYFELNTYDPLIFHKVCYLEDHLLEEGDFIISGVGTTTTYPYGKHTGIKRTFVLCKRFTFKDLTEMKDSEKEV